MTVSEIKRAAIDEPAPGRSAGDDSAAALRCDDCGAAVDSVQRYCVVCGAHRRGVRDPAARYLSEASARGRLTTRAAARPVARAARRRTLSTGTALLLALIPAAGVAGYVIGDSGSSAPAPAAAAHHQTVKGGSGTGSAARSRGTAPGASRGTASGGTTSRGAASGGTGSSYVQSQTGSPNTVTIP
jgi:hypothetical protein